MFILIFFFFFLFVTHECKELENFCILNRVSKYVKLSYKTIFVEMELLKAIYI